MPNPETVSFCCIDLANLTATDDEGRDYPIVDLWDEYGQDTDDSESAVFAVVRMAPDWLVGIDLEEFVDAPLH